MFMTVGIDMLHTVIETKNLQDFETQRSWLLEYSNSELDKIRDLYRTMVPRIIGEELKNIQYERPSAARGQSPLGKESETPKSTTDEHFVAPNFTIPTIVLDF
jgi:hypothetical protein